MWRESRLFHKGFHNIEVAWIVGADAAGIIVQEDYVGFHVTFTVCNSENNIISVEKKYSTEAGLLQGITNDVNPSNGGATHTGSGLKVRKT
jgi:hypothetical protein